MIGLVFLLLSFTSFAAEPDTPARVEALVGKFAALNGPNCWDSALFAAGLVSGIRHVDYDEFSAWLSSPLCEEVAAGAARAGDIVALRRARLDGRPMPFPYTAEIHGYYLLAPGLAFTKNGTMKTDGYQIQDTASIHANYESVNKKDCRMLGLPKELCAMKAQYFRCAPDTSVVVGLEKKVAVLEEELHRLYSGEFAPASLEAEKESIKRKVDALTSELDAVSSAEGSWKIELLRYRLVSARILQF